MPVTATPLAYTPQVRNNGITPYSHVRNGMVTNAPVGVIDQLNMVLNRRMKVHYRESFAQADINTASGVGTALRGEFHTSPTVREVRATVVVMPSEVVSAGVYDYYMEFSVGQAGGALTAQPQFKYQRDEAGAYTVLPNDLITYTQTFKIAGANLAGNATYDWSLATYAGFRPCAVTIYEVTRPTFTESTGVHPSRFQTNAHILDTDVQQAWSFMNSIRTRQGASIFSYSAPEMLSTGPITRTSATYANAIDQTKSGYNANHPGHYFWPYRRGSFSSTNVPIRLWVYGSTSGGTAGKIRLRDSAGVVATISNIGAAGWYRATGNLDSSMTSTNLIAEVACDGVNTVSIHAFGAYQYE